MVHGSGANSSCDRRIGFAIRYIPTRIRQTAGPRDSATLVRGHEVFGNFDLEPRPSTDLDPAMLALHRELQRATGEDPVPRHGPDKLLT